MYSTFLLPLIVSTTLTAPTSATLIDNIFNNNFNALYTSGNLVIILSNYHAQFLIMENQLNLFESKKKISYAVTFKK